MADSRRSAIGFVLVHGAELGAWLWERVIPLLAHPAAAVDLPGRGTRPADARAVTFEDAVAAIVEDARRCAADRVVLLVHSFSGVLAPPAVAALGDRVAAVVFVGATVPVEGRSWLDLQPRIQQVVLRLIYRAKPAGVLSPAGQNRRLLCNDLDDQTTAEFLERRVPEPPGPLLSPVSPARLPRELPRHYVTLTRDRSAKPATRNVMIARLGDAVHHEMASGHLPMLRMPREFAALLEGIAADLDA